MHWTFIVFKNAAWPNFKSLCAICNLQAGYIYENEREKTAMHVMYTRSTMKINESLLRYSYSSLTLNAKISLLMVFTDFICWLYYIYLLCNEVQVYILSVHWFSSLNFKEEGISFSVNFYTSLKIYKFHKKCLNVMLNLCEKEIDSFFLWTPNCRSSTIYCVDQYEIYFTFQQTCCCNRLQLQW